MEAAFQNQIGELDFLALIPSADPATTFGFNAGPGHKWGYGLLLNADDVSGARRAGSDARAGLLDTRFWVDPASGITGTIYTQFLPFVPQEAMAMYAVFEKALYASR